MSQLDRIEQMLSTMNDKLDTLEMEVAGLKTEMVEVKGEVAGLNKRSAMKEDLRKLELVMARQDDLLRLEGIAAKQDDLLTVIDVLGRGTEEVAVTAQLRTDAGYVALESLFKGLEDRLHHTKLELGQYAENGLKEVHANLQTVHRLVEEQTESLNQMKREMEQRFSQMSDIMRSWVYKQNLLDNELKMLKEMVEKISGDFEQK
ncbi:hypothetical protein [Laceyella putida]|uniref:Uncharacterized protein n=1 Tax=Laceyella putida TaxID=110101 RepID=A0ABW2RLV6_9BACL